MVLLYLLLSLVGAAVGVQALNLLRPWIDHVHYTMYMRRVQG